MYFLIRIFLVCICVYLEFISLLYVNIFWLCFRWNILGAFSLKCSSVRFRSVPFRGDHFAGCLFVGCGLFWSTIRKMTYYVAAQKFRSPIRSSDKKCNLYSSFHNVLTEVDDFYIQHMFVWPQKPRSPLINNGAKLVPVPIFNHSSFNSQSVLLCTYRELISSGLTNDMFFYFCNQQKLSYFHNLYCVWQFEDV